MSSEFKELEKMLREIRNLIQICEPGDGRDAYQRRFDRVIDRVRALPKRIACQAPFADDMESAAVVRAELLWVIDGWYEA